MVTSTKITLSQQELQMVNDKEWILTKRKIIDKVMALLGQVSEKFKPIADKEKEWLPGEVINSEPKIYKGENYRMLPYVLLDYPRRFEAADAFAIRTLFWWGHFFSITLHLAGKYKNKFETAIINNSAILARADFFICINEDQWQHHFEADNYLPVNEMDVKKLEQITGQRPFLKLTLQFSLQQWDEIPDLLEESFALILQLLKP